MDELLRFLEIITDGSWNVIPDLCKQSGINVTELCAYVDELADEAGVNPPFTLEDFDVT